MATQLVTFEHFSKLPLELRDQIWSNALPEPRVYEVLDSPSSSKSQPGPSYRLMFADVRNEPPPHIARVSHDARQAVLRRYRPLVFSGTVKYLDLGQDIVLLDSYLQVRRLLKVIRLLNQVEPVRQHAIRLALGTSWGLHTGLHLRLFHKTLQTRRNMRKFLDLISKFRRLETVILVVYQRSAFNLRVSFPDRQRLPWEHHDLYETYHSGSNVNFNFDNYWLRRPYQSRLVKYDPEPEKVEKPSALPRYAKHGLYEPQPRSHQVLDLKRTFENWLGKVAEEKPLASSEPVRTPSIETATLTWIYTGFASGLCTLPGS